MSERTLDLFVEDRAHEEFVSALVSRIATEENQEIRIRVRSGRGGHGKALEELKLYQRSVEKGILSAPDLVVVAIDANCQGFRQAHQQIESRVLPEFRQLVLVACPDPHIERWYMADPISFKEVVGRQPRLEKVKCERNRYKTILAQTIRDSGQITTLGGIEFARDLVGAMDLYRAGKLEPALKSFIEDLRGALRAP